MSATHKRIMLKLSGEMLGKNGFGGVDEEAIEHVSSEISKVADAGYEVAVVIGGGNFFRGTLASRFGIERAAADYMGMLATCINGLALQAVLENKFKTYTRVLTAIKMTELAEEYIRRKAIKHLEKKRVVIFVGGTGNPLFTTDTAASLRALEVNATIILKGTKVDGIYDKDPALHDDAKKYQNLSYLDVISKKLNVMDATAITMCMEANMPIKVFNLATKSSILRVLSDPDFGTLVS
ncbi:MAG: UMP kinase [Proteobacteria bacterium]|nr:UMP kinase [Pseudomonadota bacterium]